MAIGRCSMRGSIAILAVLFLPLAAGNAWGYIYTITDLRPLDARDSAAAGIDTGEQMLGWANATKEAYPLPLVCGGGRKTDRDGLGSIDSGGQVVNWANAPREVCSLALVYGGGTRIDLDDLMSADSSDSGQNAPAKAGDATGLTPLSGSGMTRDILSSDERR